MEPRILVVDNEERMVKLVSGALQLEGFEVHGVTSGKEALESFKNSPYDIVVSDLKMQPLDGLQVLQMVKELKPSCEVVLITAYASQETALEAMQKGAYDYIIKPFKMDELVLRVRRIVRQKKLEIENQRLKQGASGPFVLEGFIGKSKKMRQVFELIQRVAQSDATVLIRGESGTGKELAARAVHQQSNRKDKKLLSINCAALPETLLESELFGYEKGAFSGATQQKRGLFEVASGGTLFLDEIGDLSLGLQAKLLRVLQQKEIIRLGGNSTIKIDVRLVTATHKNLEKMQQEQLFRQDLYYRINTFPLELPPLRERKEDIPELINHFMDNYPDKALSAGARRKLMDYNYPGNVRELENIIARAAIVSGSLISDVEIPVLQEQTPKEKNTLSMAGEGINLDDHIAGLLKQAIKKSAGNKTEAARLLGITRRRLYSMLKSYDIES